MTKWTAIILAATIAITVALALPEYKMCEDVLDLIDTPCTMLTPNLDCDEYSYNLTRLSTGTLIVENGSVAYLNDSLYYFNFTEEAYGAYLLTYCGGVASRQINVRIKEPEFNMLGTYIGLIIAAIVLILIGVRTQTKGVRFGALGLAAVQLMIVMGLTYAFQAGLDPTPLLKANFWGLFLIGGVVGIVFMFEEAARMLTPDGDENVRGWQREGGWNR